MSTSRKFIKQIIFILLFGGFIMSGTAYARIYTFIDEAGTIHFSNVPTDVRYKAASISKIREHAQTAQYSDRKTDNSTYEYDAFVRNAARRHEVDPLLVKSIIKAESAFNPVAVSSVGAQGLMQIMPMNFKDLDIRDPFDPEQNIKGGARYFSQLLKRFGGNLQLAIAAYNAGPEAVEQYKRIPPYKETMKYVKRVMRYYKTYRKS